MYDDFSLRRMKTAGLHEGGEWWELGAGLGRTAKLMAEVVGAHGKVFATDRKVVKGAEYAIETHDVVTDRLPGGDRCFDGIHARMVLAHLGAREEVTLALTNRLRPGGALVIEEMGLYVGYVAFSDISGAYQVVEEYNAALRSMFDGFGNDATWPRRIGRVLGDAGLVDIDVETHAQTWAGGSAGCWMSVAVSTDMSEHLNKHGFDEQQLNLLHAVLTHPSTRLAANPLISTIGYKPAV